MIKSKRRRHSLQPHAYKSRYLVITENYLLPLAVILFSLFLVYLLFYSSLFRVKHISCFRDQQPCQDPFILAEIKKYHHLNIFRFPQEQLRSRLLQGNQTITEINLSFQLPDRVRLDLTSTTPRLAIHLPSSQEDRYLLIDQNLRPISLSQSPLSLPSIELDKAYSFQLGQTITDPRLQTAFKIIMQLTSWTQQPPTFSLQGKLLKANLTQPKVQVLFTLDKDPQSQLQLLQAVLGEVTMLEEQQVKLIDVRFNQPVLKSN